MREKEDLVAKKGKEIDVEQLRVVRFESLYNYLHTLFDTRDPILSAQISQMHLYHRPELLDSIHKCHPDIVID